MGREPETGGDDSASSDGDVLMARIRTIKPEFFTSEDIVSLSPLARLLYIALWCEADRDGRFVWKPATFKLRYLPGDSCDVLALCKELQDASLVELYGEGYAWIPAFKSHQHLNPREADSLLPDPHASTTRQPRVGSRKPRDSDAQGGREGKGKEGDGRVVDGLDVQVWERWVDYRIKIRKPIKPASILAAQQELAGFGANQSAVVEKSIASGWQGLFAPKGVQAQPQQPKQPEFRCNTGTWEQRDPVHGWFPVSETEVPENLRGAA